MRLWKKREEVEEDVADWRASHHSVGLVVHGGMLRGNEESETSLALESTPQLLLERLPFLTKIRKPRTAIGFNGVRGDQRGTTLLDRITKMGGPSHDIQPLLGDDDDDDEEENHNDISNARTGTVAPTIASQTQTQMQTEKQEESADIMQKLYLSDDDIED